MLLGNWPSKCTNKNKEIRNCIQILTYERHRISKNFKDENGYIFLAQISRGKFKIKQK